MERYFKRKLSQVVETDSGDDDSSSSASASTQHIVPMTSAKKESVDLEDGIDYSNAVEYSRLCIAIDCCRFIMHQRWPFHNLDETSNSSNRGNFLELIKFLSEQSDFAALRKASQNSYMVAPDLHKDISHCFVQEILKKIKEELKDDFFSLILDESSDLSGNEQMTMVLRYVDSDGNVKERFIGVVNVMEISALSLKNVFDKLLVDSGLNLMNIRGQAYNGASNMEAEFSELKTLIMKENHSAYYVHCFSHQFQLSVVQVALRNDDIADFYCRISPLAIVIRASCGHKDAIQRKQVEKVIEGIKNGVIERTVVTYWGTEYKSLLNLVALFSSVLEVLELVSCYADDPLKRRQARDLLRYFRSFDFVFSLQLMLTILEITNDLSLALERKDEGILDALALVKVTKTRLQTVRDDGWGSLLSKVSAFCNENEIDFVDMNDDWSKRNITNEFHYRVECFNANLDAQLLEINDRFNDANSELLHCVAGLSPSDGFRNFNTKTLVKLAQFYPDDFEPVDCLMLSDQLETYIINMRADNRFSQLKSLVDLSTLLVQTRKDEIFTLVYRLLKLALVLPIAPASVERCSCAIKIVKEELNNRVCDQFSNDYLVCCIEDDLLMNICLEDVMDRLPKYENA